MVKENGHRHVIIDSSVRSSGGKMKQAVNVEELKKLMPSSRSTIYSSIIGVQICMVAFLFSQESMLFTVLLFLGAAALTEGYEKTRLQNKLKQIIQ
jgi:hypothetical protein